MARGTVQHRLLTHFRSPALYELRIELPLSEIMQPRFGRSPDMLALQHAAMHATSLHVHHLHMQAQLLFRHHLCLMLSLLAGATR